MVLKNTEDIFIDNAGPKFDSLPKRRFTVESSVDDDVDPLDDRIGVQDLASLSELSEEIIVNELQKRYVWQAVTWF